MIHIIPTYLIPQLSTSVPTLYAFSCSIAACNTCLPGRRLPNSISAYGSTLKFSKINFIATLKPKELPSAHKLTIERDTTNLY